MLGGFRLSYGRLTMAGDYQKGMKLSRENAAESRTPLLEAAVRNTVRISTAISAPHFCLGFHRFCSVSTNLNLDKCRLKC
jgi:hypothetical protein